MLTRKHDRPWSFCACCNEPPAAAGVNRRQFVAGAALTGLAATSFAPKLFAEAAPGRIDVHHHMASPSWLQTMEAQGFKNPPIQHWSIQKSLDDMDKGGVATAVLSTVPPQAKPFSADVSARVAREANEYGKKLTLDHPGRFGLFATLPLPHIDESLKEIAYAFDTLKANGIGVMTNYGDKWLGYSYFAPVWEELNRRKATVYTHPADANCCVNLVEGLPSTAVEYGADTMRTIANLIFSGTAQKYGEINWIFSHGGGALTAFAERLLVQMVSLPPYQGKFTRETVQAALDRFHYDTAQIAMAGTLTALAKLVPVSQIVFGSDFPYRHAAEQSNGVDALFSGNDLKNVNRENALRILPQLKSA